MKIKIMILALSTALFACQSPVKQRSTPADPDSSSASSPAENKTATDGEFDTSKIPVSDKELGKFPYLHLPQDYTFGYDKEIKATDINNADKEYFAVKGKLIPLEGKTYKATLEKDRSKDNTRFSSLVAGKALEKEIIGLGGVNVNNIPVPKSEIERVGDTELITNKHGHSIDYNMLDDIKTYIIKTKDKEVWIQYLLMNEESGIITVLEKSITQ